MDKYKLEYTEMIDIMEKFTVDEKVVTVMESFKSNNMMVYQYLII